MLTSKTKKERLELKIEVGNMVQIVTESISDIPSHIADSYNIVILPTRVLFGRNIYKESIDLDAERFYRLTNAESNVPVITPPSPTEIYQIFETINRGGDDILYISSNYEFEENVEVALKYLKLSNFVIYKTKGVSMFQGIIAIQAAVLAQFGYSIDEITSLLDKISSGTFGYLFTDKKSRIGTELEVNFLNKIFNIFKRKKLVSINTDGATDHSYFRSYDNPIYELFGRIKERYAKDESLLVSILHFQDPIGASTLQNKIKENFTSTEIILSKIGSSLSMSTQPGTLLLVISPILDEYASYFQ